MSKIYINNHNTNTNNQTDNIQINNVDTFFKDDSQVVFLIQIENNDNFFQICNDEPEKQENDIIATEVKNINDTTVINVDANHNYGNNNDYDIELINNIDENYIYHRREQISIIYCKCLFCLVYIVPIFVILFMYIVKTETHHKTR